MFIQRVHSLTQKGARAEIAQAPGKRDLRPVTGKYAFAESARRDTPEV